MSETGDGSGGSAASREPLEDAMAHPERYRTLCVRMYGFSEYFVCLPESKQLEVIARTGN